MNREQVINKLLTESANWEEFERKLHDYNWENHRNDLDSCIRITDCPDKFKIDPNKQYTNRLGQPIENLQLRESTTAWVLHGQIRRSKRRTEWCTWKISGQKNAIKTSDDDLIEKPA